MKITIIGGSGGIGKLFSDFLSHKGVEVDITGRSDSKEDYKSKIESADLVFLTIPIDSVEKVVEGLSNFYLKDKVIVNFSSNMTEGFKVLKKLDCDSCCLHPLFGPDIVDFTNQNVIIAPKIDSTNLTAFVDLLEKEGANIRFSEVEEHDRMMAVVQALSQFSTISLAKTISNIGMTKKDLRDFSSLSFRSNAATIERIMMQPAELWFNIQFFNENFPEILKVHLESSEKLRGFVLEKDREGFIEFFNEAKDFWNEEKEEVYQETRKNLEKISKENSIGVLGPEGTFSQQAANKYDSTLKNKFFDSNAEVINAVADGTVERAIVAFDNSIHGTVRDTVDGIYKNDLKVIKEISIPIEHCISTLKKIPKSDVKEIYGHPQAINQCKNYLTKNFPNP